MHRAQHFDGFHVQASPHDVPLTHTDDDDTPKIERFATDLRTVPSPLGPFRLAILARSEQFCLEVGDLPEEVRPVVAHGVSPPEGAARMGRLLALIVGGEAARERFQIVAIDGVTQTLVHGRWLTHRCVPSLPLPQSSAPWAVRDGRKCCPRRPTGMPRWG